MTRRPNSLKGRAHELAIASGLNPDARMAKPDNMAVCLNTPCAAIQHKVQPILQDIWKSVLLRLGRNDDQKINNLLFDDLDVRHAADMSKAMAQFSMRPSGDGTVSLTIVQP